MGHAAWYTTKTLHRIGVENDRLMAEVNIEMKVYEIDSHFDVIAVIIETNGQF